MTSSSSTGTCGAGSGRRAHGGDALFLEAPGGDLLEVAVALVESDARIPDLDDAADSDEQGEILDPALAAHHRGQDDPAAGVVGDVLGHAEHAAGAGIMVVERAAALLLGEPAALDVGAQVAGIIAAVGGQAGRDLVGADDDRPGVGAALDDASGRRRERRDAPWRPPR